MKPQDHAFPVPLPFRTARLLAAAVLTLLAVPALAQQGFDQYPPQAPVNQTPTPYPPPSGDPSSGQMPPGGQPSYPPAQGSPGGYGMPGGSAPAAQGNPLQALLQQELQDFGVPPQAQLQNNMHGPTPTSIPGGQVITTDRLLGLYQQGQQNGLLVFHVLGPGDMLPNAQNAVPASQPGSFNDQTQQEFGQYLQQVTQGNTSRPLVFYCLNTQCWMSYNAALRAINMGFSNVLWYRGGIEAWQQVQRMASSLPQPGQATGAPVSQPPQGYR